MGKRGLIYKHTHFDRQVHSQTTLLLLDKCEYSLPPGYSLCYNCSWLSVQMLLQQCDQPGHCLDQSNCHTLQLSKMLNHVNQCCLIHQLEFKMLIWVACALRTCEDLAMYNCTYICKPKEIDYSNLISCWTRSCSGLIQLIANVISLASFQMFQFTTEFYSCCRTQILVSTDWTQDGWKIIHAIASLTKNRLDARHLGVSLSEQ